MFDTTKPLEYIFLESYTDYLNKKSVDRYFVDMLTDALIHTDFRAGEVVIRIQDRNLFPIAQALFGSLAYAMGYRLEIRGAGHFAVFDEQNVPTVFAFYNTISLES